ncbi:MAG TPA: ATP-binding cassette domain-containing protein, partial [Thermoanaerobaculia bacterium]
AENVMLPMDFHGALAPRKRHTRAIELLSRVGVAPQAEQFPATLSGGEQQRVAVARALANDPPVILADEPTGNLDSTAGASIFRLLIELQKEGKTVLLVTHDRDLLTSVDRTVTIADGRIAFGQG